MNKLLTASFRLTVAPENGADATVYWLIPSVTQVKRKADGVHLPEYVSCECMGKTGAGNPVPGLGTIKFVLTYKTGSASAEFIYASRIIVTSDIASIAFRLYVGGVKVDEKTVAVVDDGATGAPGPVGARGLMPYPCGKWNATTRYTATDKTAPYVYYEPGKTVYVMNKVTSVVGLNPASDYAANGTNATWIPFEKFVAIYTEILMADFGKLASTVFFGDYLFSQEGVDDRGLPTSEYGNFTPSTLGKPGCLFTPNIYMNFLTGYAEFNKVKARGDIILNYQSVQSFNGEKLLDISKFRNFYSNVYYTDTPIYALPRPTLELSGAQVRIYSGFMTTRSSGDTVFVKIDGGGNFYYHGYQPWTGASSISLIRVRAREIVLRCIYVSSSLNFWMIENYKDFESSDFNPTL